MSAPKAHDFSELSLPGGLLRVLKELGYERPTPIQAASVPILRAGKDLIGQSKTGSGKTTAFAIPLLESIDTGSRRPQALVLCPTRELCAQVARETRKLGRYKNNVQVLTLSGGHPVYLDLRSLEHGAQVVVGTPGRVQDHIDRGSLDLGVIRFVVLDEADRMLDMGFREKIEAILQKTPSEKQIALFSATYPPTIESLGKRYLRSPERVTVESPATETPDIEQICYLVSPEAKVEALLAFLRSRRLDSALIFCNLKARVDEITQTLRQAGHFVDKLHGDLEQRDRDCVMAKFRNHSTRLLVATDVAARGIDVVGLDAVINYDLTPDPDHYVHRIGRTGRAGKKGLAVSFLTSGETAKLERIQAYLKAEIPLLESNVLSGASLSIEAAPMATLIITGGRKDKLRPGDILGALTGDAGLKGDQIGKIEIHDHISYVAIARGSANMALERLRRVRIKARRYVISRAW